MSLSMPCGCLAELQEGSEISMQQTSPALTAYGHSLSAAGGSDLGDCSFFPACRFPPPSSLFFTLASTLPSV